MRFQIPKQKNLKKYSHHKKCLNFALSHSLIYSIAVITGASHIDAIDTLSLRKHTLVKWRERCVPLIILTARQCYIS